MTPMTFTGVGQQNQKKMQRMTTVPTIYKAVALLPDTVVNWLSLLQIETRSLTSSTTQER
jgi:hypothetical protein